MTIIAGDDLGSDPEADIVDQAVSVQVTSGGVAAEHQDVSGFGFADAPQALVRGPRVSISNAQTEGQRVEAAPNYGLSVRTCATLDVCDTCACTAGEIKSRQFIIRTCTAAGSSVAVNNGS